MIGALACRGAVPPAGPALPIALLLATVAPPSGAQMSASLDGAGTRVAYSGVPGASAFSLTPTLQVTDPSVSIIATGTFSHLDGGGWSLQGTTSGSVFTRGWSGFQLEGGALAAGSTHEDGSGTAALRGRGRLHWYGARAGLWGGGEVGTAWNSVQWQPTKLADIGAWVRAAPFTVVASASPTWIGDSLRYIDGEGTLRLVGGALELAAFGGVRHWTAPSGIATEAWGGASAAVWLNRHLAIVGGGGSYLADYGQGFPAGSYVTLGVRLATRRPAEPERAPQPVYTPPRTLPRPLVPAFEIRPLGGGRRLVRLTAPRAQRVEIIGDFTEWRPVSLRRGSDSEWTATVTIPPGTYRMNIRVDGGPWGVPPGVTPLQDDFGVVGILRVDE